MKVVLAVSGGVDSVVMLHAISENNKTFGMELDLIVAHFDHGIREDSAADARFVEALSYKYGLKCVTSKAQLVKDTSEAVARSARWKFLKDIREEYDAICIMTAHHADDVIETQIINLLRGTGRRGLSVLRNTDSIVRPLIKNTKQEIYDYAVKHGLEFVEDSSNIDTKYLRNRVRHLYLPKIGNQLIELKSYIQPVDENNNEIDRLVEQFSDEHIRTDKSELHIARQFIAQLPVSVAKEMLRTAVELSGAVHAKQKLSSAMIEKLLVFSNRNDSNKIIHLSKKLHARIDRQDLIIHRIS